MRFIVADRQPSIRSALKLLVEQYPNMVYAGAAGDTDNLLKLTRSAKPDLTLLEWELLGAWPKGTLADLRESSPAIIVVLSCCLDRSIPLEAGADYYVSKVDKPERLIGVIEDIRTHFNARTAAKPSPDLPNT
ncbi:response regulator transcription factor [Dehalogenimonas etheniformans]|uniref:DNA-binding response regulator n=1 Tax=Dehalogenimonas etheniformans TaxID=1536648 RepID=A0A2P5P657_9CHLR|nr:response regulator transcription factor [Dehalogenimonas etheniformans]PPD57782.1 DNA-binding response regulator [Dehalogenimonas etheniformans]QNT76123.1 response regulator transcription factor [Dehalogenimonas etheniformans]